MMQQKNLTVDVGKAQLFPLEFSLVALWSCLSMSGFPFCLSCAYTIKHRVIWES